MAWYDRALQGMGSMAGQGIACYGKHGMAWLAGHPPNIPRYSLCPRPVLSMLFFFRVFAGTFSRVTTSLPSLYAVEVLSYTPNLVIKIVEV